MPPPRDAPTQPAPLPRSNYVSTQQLTQLAHVDPWMDRQVATILLDLEQDFQLKPAVRLHNITFTDNVAMGNHFWRLMRRHPPGQPIPEPFHQQLLALLMKGHYKPETKIGVGVDFFYTGKSEYGTPCFMLKRKDGSEEDFSYRKSVGNIFTNTWTPVEGPSVMAVLRGCATVFLAREHIMQDPLLAQPARDKLFNLCRSLRIDLPQTPADATNAALAYWTEQKALFEQDYPSDFNACMGAHTLQTLARLCKADPSCRQLVAETEVVPQVLELLQQEEDGLSPHHAVCVLWELYSLRYSPPDWLMRRLQYGVVQRSGNVALQPVDCVRAVEALLGLQCSVGRLISALQAEVDTELKAGGRLGMQLLVALLRSCVRLKQAGPTTRAVPHGLPQLVMEVLNRQPVEQLGASKVVLLLHSAAKLQLQPSQQLLRAAAQVASRTDQAPLVPVIWALLARLRFVPGAEGLAALEAWSTRNAHQLHFRGLQRLAWALGRFAPVQFDPLAAGSGAAVACLQGLFATAAAMRPPCPLPLATASLWAAVQWGAEQEVPGFEELWGGVNGQPRETYDALRQLPRPHVQLHVLLQLLEVGDALQESGSELQPLHQRLRQTAESALQPAVGGVLQGESGKQQGSLTPGEALRRAAEAVVMSEGNVVRVEGLGWGEVQTGDAEADGGGWGR